MLCLYFQLLIKVMLIQKTVFAKWHFGSTVKKILTSTIYTVIFTTVHYITFNFAVTKFHEPLNFFSFSGFEGYKIFCDSTKILCFAGFKFREWRFWLERLYFVNCNHYCILMYNYFIMGSIFAGLKFRDFWTFSQK